METLYFKQFLSGRDFATADPLAAQMRNFSYAIGDTETREAVLVDPTYDVETLLNRLKQDEMTLTGVLLTHYHADHAGGSMMGYNIIGVSELLEKISVPIHIQQTEKEWIQKITDISEQDMTLHIGGDTVHVGNTKIELLHTPGHTPGSQCLLVERSKLITGDTLFLHGCGRTDLPGGNPAELYDSLTKKLSNVPENATLYPGHQYSEKSSDTFKTVKNTNTVFKPSSEEEWLNHFS